MSDKYQDGKYVVFKVEDYSAMMVRNERIMPIEMKHVLLQTQVNDAVVIRLQDIFAGPALHSYAASIAIALKFVPKASEQYTELQAVADFFHEAALRADEIAHADHAKLPD